MAETKQELDARAAALAEDIEDRIIVEHRGFKYEVRSPTLAQNRALQRAVKDKETKETDGVKLMVLMAIECTYHPATNTKVFSRADEEVLMTKSTSPSTIIGKISKALSKLMSEKPDDVEKNSEGEPSAS